MSHDDLLNLALDVGKKWEPLCRILLDEKELEQIDHDQKSLYDKSFTMLKRWTGAQASSATYAALGMALMTLMHDEPDTEDLCTIYCLESQSVMESSV